MAVPASGNFNQAGTADTTIQGAVVAGGGTAANNLNALITNSSVARFDLSLGITSLSQVTNSNQYRNYPITVTPSRTPTRTPTPSNSPIPPGPPLPAGTLISTYCKYGVGNPPFEQWGNYADGNYGSYTQLKDANAIACGADPPAGYVLSTFCNNPGVPPYELYANYADGSGGSNPGPYLDNQVECGAPPPSPSNSPAPSPTPSTSRLVRAIIMQPSSDPYSVTADPPRAVDHFIYISVVYQDDGSTPSSSTRNQYVVTLTSWPSWLTITEGAPKAGGGFFKFRSADGTSGGSGTLEFSDTKGGTLSVAINQS